MTSSPTVCAIPGFDFPRGSRRARGHTIGTLNEDFAIESIPCDVFQLGEHSWLIRR